MIKGKSIALLIDLNPHGESALQIADRLVQQKKSFAIATGYDSEFVPDRLKGIPRVEKPFDPPALLGLVDASSRATGNKPAG